MATSTTTIMGTTRSRTDRFLKYRRAVQGGSIVSGPSAQDRCVLRRGRGGDTALPVGVHSEALAYTRDGGDGGGGEQTREKGPR